MMIQRNASEVDFGWKYIHCFDTSGMFLNAIIHEGSMFGFDKKPYITITGKTPDGVGFRIIKKHTIANIDIKNNLISTEGFHQDKNECKFDIFEGDDCLSLSICRTLPSFCFDDGCLIKSPSDTEKSSYWALDDMKSLVQGRLRIHSRDYEFNGFAYSDRQWGNLLIQDSVKLWHWCHFLSDRTLIVMFDITTYWGTKIGRALKIDFTNNLMQSSQDQMCHEVDEHGFARFIHPVFGNVQYVRSNNNLIRSRREPIAGYAFCYDRWNCVGLMDGEHLSGAVERMEFVK